MRDDPETGALAAAASGFFAAGTQIAVARAPGRLDVLGGVADYSGALVLEKTLAEGVAAGAGVDPWMQCTVRTLLADPGLDAEVTVSAELVFRGDPAELGRMLRRDPRTAWAAYALGPVAVLARSQGLRPRGLRLLIASRVPPGAGVSSSAAVEVAALLAAAAALGVVIPRADVPLLAQRAEHDVAGAPCGLMDQVTVYEGEDGTLLPLLCRPAIRRPAVAIPPGVHLVGLPSGVKHSVGGAAYRRARAAAFMGKVLLGEAGRAHLAEVSAADYQHREGPPLPESLEGAEFLARFADHGDRATRVEPDEVYPVRAAAEHPIFETERAERFVAALGRAGGGDRDAALREAGVLLDAAHDSYGAMGLGSAETDRLHDLVRQAGPAAGLYGSRVSGGGCGGTVVVLADDRGVREIPGIVAAYRAATRIAAEGPAVLDGTSPGALRFGLDWMVV